MAPSTNINEDLNMKTIKLKQETFNSYMTEIENLKREVVIATSNRANTIKQSKENSAYYKGEILALESVIAGGRMDLTAAVMKCHQYQAAIGFLSVVCVVSISINLM